MPGLLSIWRTRWPASHGDGRIPDAASAQRVRVPDAVASAATAVVAQWLTGRRIDAGVCLDQAGRGVVVAAQESRLGFSTTPDSITFEIEESIYPLEAVYGASYLFLDRCFLYLSRARDGVVGVRLTVQEASEASPANLDALAGEFANELLSQTLRASLSQSTARIREYYTAAALRAATSAPSVDDLLAELESEELLEDPLEIMVPWEEKQGEEEGEKEGSDG